MKLTSVQIVVGTWLLLIIAAGVYNMFDDKPAAPSAIGQIFAPAASTEPGKAAEAQSCVPLPLIVGDKTVILRIDDVHAYAWATTTRLMVTDAEARNMPLVLGVIPQVPTEEPIALSEDVELLTFLQQRACRHEFALHGLNHKSHGENEELAEFETLTHEEAKHRLEHGLTELAKLTSDPIKTWIPPLNRHSEGTQSALLELGITRWSTEGDGQWDYDASTYSYATNALIPTDTVLADCEQSFVDSDECIIMLHPQDFTTEAGEHDAAKYDAYYLDLLDRLFGRGYSFGTFESVAG